MIRYLKRAACSGALLAILGGYKCSLLDNTFSGLPNFFLFDYGYLSAAVSSIIRSTGLLRLMFYFGIGGPEAGNFLKVSTNCHDRMQFCMNGVPISFSGCFSFFDLTMFDGYVKTPSSDTKHLVKYNQQ